MLHIVHGKVNVMVHLLNALACGKLFDELLPEAGCSNLKQLVLGKAVRVLFLVSLSLGCPLG